MVIDHGNGEEVVLRDESRCLLTIDVGGHGKRRSPGPYIEHVVITLRRHQLAQRHDVDQCLSGRVDDVDGVNSFLSSSDFGDENQCLADSPVRRNAHELSCHDAARGFGRVTEQLFE